MKSLITICIAVSLFGPTVAKWMTYADCMFKAQNSLQICDCAKIVTPGVGDTPTEETTKLKDLQLKTDWTLINMDLFSADSIIALKKMTYDLFSFYFPSTTQQRLFRPPSING